MSDQVDCIVIGGGVVGLATARALANHGLETIVAERHAGIGEETSSRNSEVIHAGLYYPSGSLKAQFCALGRAMLYDYCESRQIKHRRCGKLVVATDSSQRDRLKAIKSQAEANGVDDLLELSGAEVTAREPELDCVAGLWSPSTGIVDSHGLMTALAGDLEAAGGIIATRTTISAIEVTDRCVQLSMSSDGESAELKATHVINAAGLHAGELARLCTGVAGYQAPMIRYAKGNYFNYSGKRPFQSLVYPLPVNNGLGVHATIDLGGALRFGPDVEWIDDINYDVNPDRRDAFAESIRNYWPGLDSDALTPAYAGIRPKLVGPGEPPADFRIDALTGTGNSRLVHLLGIESPGLTAALAIAEHVCEIVRQNA